MAKNSVPPQLYPIYSTLLADSNHQYVISSFLIELPEDVSIGLVSIRTTKGTIESPPFSAKGLITDIVYQAYESNSPADTYSFEHPPLLGYPHKVTILVRGIGSGTSSVTDLAGI
jgi:hypothetical protein